MRIELLIRWDTPQSGDNYVKTEFAGTPANCAESLQDWAERIGKIDERHANDGKKEKE